MKPCSPFPNRTRAFTLIELLASMTVLALLLTMVLQMINSAIAVTAGSAKRLDADSQVRFAFDRMAIDFAQIVKRLDVDYYFPVPKNTSDDQFAFYSETTGYFPTAINNPANPVARSNAALVGYRIYKSPAANGTTGSAGSYRRLERLNKALVWAGVSNSSTGSSSGSNPNLRPMTFLPQTMLATWPGITADDPTPVVDPSGAVVDNDPYYQVIGESIFRMETCYLVGNAATPPRLSATPFIPAAGATVPSSPPLPYNAMRDVIAVVVTLAVLDDASRLAVTPQNLEDAANKLEDVTLQTHPTVFNGTPLPTTLPLSTAAIWQKDIANNALASTLPQRAASQVRIYERYFYLGNAH